MTETERVYIEEIINSSDNVTESFLANLAEAYNAKLSDIKQLISKPTKKEVDVIEEELLTTVFKKTDSNPIIEGRELVITFSDGSKLNLKFDKDIVDLEKF